jgi:hypothetical protein
VDSDNESLKNRFVKIKEIPFQEDWGDRRSMLNISQLSTKYRIKKWRKFKWDLVYSC